MYLDISFGYATERNVRPRYVSKIVSYKLPTFDSAALQYLNNGHCIRSILFVKLPTIESNVSTD